jgi:hypothetical protein
LFAAGRILVALEVAPGTVSKDRTGTAVDQPAVHHQENIVAGILWWGTIGRCPEVHEELARAEVFPI